MLRRHDDSNADVATAYGVWECEDPANPVTEENGVSVDYYVLRNVRLKVFLHHACVAGWSYKFALPLPSAKYLN
jgi:hypothetical protein